MNMMKEKFEKNFTKQDGCWEWQKGKFTTGYGVFCWEGKRWVASRASLFIYRGIELGKNYALHKCDNPACVNPDHLFVGDASVNAQDKKNKGRAQRLPGELHPRAKLTQQAVEEIRSEVLRPYEYAKKFGVSLSAITSVRKGRNWGKNVCNK